MEKAAKQGGDGDSPFNQLPDDIVVQIYNKIMDLKTLCHCQLISKRLGLLVFQADTISFDVPLPIDYETENCLDDLNLLFNLFRLPLGTPSSPSDLDDSDPALLLEPDSFPSAIEFIKRFTKLKSICIQFPSYVNLSAVDGVSLFQWKIKLCSRADSLVIQALNSEDVLESEEEGSDEEREHTNEDKDYDKTLSCLMGVVDRLKKLLGCTVEFPLLEKVFIMGSNERGVVTLSVGEIDKLRNLLRSYGTDTSEHLVYHTGEISDTSSE